MSVSGFVDELASDSPAPGGGSVAALAGSMAAGLGAMVAALTHGKRGYKQHDELMEQVGVKGQALKATLLAALDRDTEAFDAVMACFRMARKTDEQKAARDAAIMEANKGATEVPLGVLEAIPEVLELLGEVVAKGNKNSLSDGGVGGQMARAAAYGAYYNVAINLAEITDEAWCAEINARAGKALGEVDRLAAEIEGRLMEAWPTA